MQTKGNIPGVRLTDLSNRWVAFDRAPPDVREFLRTCELEVNPESVPHDLTLKEMRDKWAPHMRKLTALLYGPDHPGAGC